MKRMAMLLAVIAVMFAGSTQAALFVDFGRPDTPVQEGYQGFQASHENALELYVPQDFEAFDTTITISLDWGYLPRWEAMQMIDRGGNDGSDTPDLLRDWTGIDGRVYGSPLTVTISGLPAGEYKWISIHHDTEDQTGLFDVLIKDAAGEKTATGIDISHGAKGAEIITLAEATKFSTALISDGSDIKLSFTPSFEDGAVTAEKFFVMNAFQIIPEPATIALLAIGGIGLIRRRK